MPKNKFLILLFLIPLLIVFKGLFTSKSLTAGDAPYLTSSMLNLYRSEPSAWIHRGTFLGGVNQFLWISPYMILISLFEYVTHFSSALLIRIFFYIPAVISGLYGAYFLAKQLKFSSKVAILTAFVYVLNTYFILLIDGGQVGIALAYGLYPIAILVLNSYLTDQSRSGFYLALIALQLITIIDPRVALIAVGTVCILQFKKLKNLLLLMFFWIIINLYWLYPMLHTNGLASSSSIDQFTSLLNGIFLYSPHWPQNYFGVITYPSAFFTIYPLLVLLQFLKPSKKVFSLLVIYLLSVFAIKGTTPPLGNVYEFFVSLPFGSSFRDSTKFFLPLSLVTGILVGSSLEQLEKRKYIGKVAFFTFYVLLLCTLAPSLLQRMNFVLRSTETNDQVHAINDQIVNASLNRVAWIPEKDPRSVESISTESIDAKDIVNERPFARLNVGSSDRLNFLNNNQANTWLDIYGIQAFVASGDPRRRALTVDQQKEWDQTNATLQKVPYLEVNGSLYKNSDTLPRFVGTNKLIVTTEPDSIYDQLVSGYPKFNPANIPLLFVEDGKWNPQVLNDVASESAILVEGEQGKERFSLSQLTNFFMSPDKAVHNQFATYSTSEYLKYKYELLVREFEFKDFDYANGIAFSSNRGESLTFSLNAPKNGRYILAIRSLNTESSEYTIENNTYTLPPSTVLKWNLRDLDLSQGQHEVKLQNNSSLMIINVVALIPQEEYKKAEAQTNSIYEKFIVYNINNLPNSLFNESWQSIPYETVGTNMFRLTVPEKINWITFNDRYSSEFYLSKDHLKYQSLPVYSGLNGFYRRPEWSTVTISYSGQEDVRWGIYFSIVGILLLVVGDSIKWNYERLSKKIK